MKIMHVRVMPSGDGDFFISGKDSKTQKTRHLHHDGEWRDLAITVDPKDSTKRLRTGYFKSEDLAKHAISQWEQASSREAAH